MGYAKSLELAGCEILDFKEFGSYQGTWLAFVKYNGEVGIVEGAYGSCSVCDAYQAAFDWNEMPTEKDGKYFRETYSSEEMITKEEYDSLMAAYRQKHVEFAAPYLNGGLYSKEHYANRLLKLNSEDWFDEEEKEYCEWAIAKFNEFV